MKVSAGRILMLLENAYPQDSRVRHEAETLQAQGYQVYVIAQHWKNQSATETVKGVVVYRLPELNLFTKSNLKSSRFRIIWNNMLSAIGYFAEYVYFTAACFLVSLFIAFRHGFQVIHLHNPPNTLVVIALFYRLFGVQFVFDHHDLSAELFLSRYRKKGGFIYRYLLWEEKICLRLASIIIATNESYKEIDMVRGRRAIRDIFVVRNGPVPEEMPSLQADTSWGRMDKMLLVYIGIMGPQDGVDYLLRSLAHLVFELKREKLYAVIIGTGDSLEDLIKLRDELQLGEYVRFTGFIPKEDLLRYLAAADICLDPNPSSPLNDHSTWIKVMEYMAYGKPIVSFDLRETRYSARDAAIYVTPNDVVAYARAIRELMDDKSRREKMGNYGYRRVWQELSWPQVSRNLILAYRNLFS